VNTAALSPEAFEVRYAGGKDPWSFAANAYELARYRTILDSLTRSVYETVYEPGCAVGVLTQQLASLAGRVIATDFAPSAVAQALKRCAGLPNVEISCVDAGTFVPAGPLDLIVFSEIGYYFSSADLSRLASLLARCLIGGGEFVAVHWLGDSEDHILHGDRVHEVLRESLQLIPQRSDRYPGFRLDSWLKR
jgi:protein-L-isoaspartate O-methyltransferase